MQRRFLVRVRGLAAFRRTVAALAISGSPLDARRRAVIVPTRAAGELLRQTIERRGRVEGRPSVILPDCVTRDEWIRLIYEALGAARALLSRTEREVLMARAWREALRAHPLAQPPFEGRPGLIAAMLDFYDEVRRRRRTVRRAVRVLFEDLRVERGSDLGSEQLIQQTRILGFTFLAYERLVAAADGMDEHDVRARVVVERPPLPFTHVVVAVADHPTDPRGLWPVDYDLLGRVSGLARVDVVVTDEAHDAGFRERLDLELPGLEEVRAPDVPWSPRLLAPAGRSHEPVWVCRDREDELRHVGRAIRARAGTRLDEAVAVVFQRPLPYLYLAQQVLGEARVPYQAFDALPLAAEPYAALLDLVLTVARTGGTRASTVGLLRSTLLAFEVDGQPVRGGDAAALDAVLAARREVGEASTYLECVDRFFRASAPDRRVREADARRAAAAAVTLAGALQPFRSGNSAFEQITAVSAFLREHERVAGPNDPSRDRFVRARGAVLSVLDELAEACRRFDAAVRDPDALVALIHHAVESRTFTPRVGSGGVHLVDAVAARFGEFEHVHLVGLVETDWPDRLKRGIFYAAGLLKSLGWPQQTDQTRAEQAAFRDVLALPSQTLSLSAFQFEGDAAVALSPMLELARGLSAVDIPPAPSVPLYDDEVLTGPVRSASLHPTTAGWLEARRQRPALTQPAYGGYVAARLPQVYRVSRVDQYVSCPFRYFAESVLRLQEEREDLTGLSPLERGTLLHRLFEEFYRSWQARGEGAITAESLPGAVACFSEIAREALANLPEADRELEQARLLGSLVAAGVAERVFELEADSGQDVVERRLEWELTGPFRFPQLGGLTERVVEIRGKADRVDVLADGSLRVVDYKLGRMPDLKSSVQTAVYALAASQQLSALDGRAHPVSAAMYLAFGDERRLEGALGGPADSVDLAVRTRAGQFALAVDAIEAGRFPPRPKRPGECAWCVYAGVCRKEYRGGEDEAADAV